MGHTHLTARALYVCLTNDQNDRPASETFQRLHIKLSLQKLSAHQERQDTFRSSQAAQSAQSPDMPGGKDYAFTGVDFAMERRLQAAFLVTSDLTR